MSIEIPAAEPHLVNLRDVATASQALRPGVLLRSDAPHAGDEVPQGVAWPPRTVVDLRDAGEGAATHPLAGVARVVALPVLDGATRTTDVQEALPLDLGSFYLELLSGVGAQHLVDGVRAVAADDAPVLVHCTAGKDRTGVLVAIVLALVGVPRVEIVADYVATDANMVQVVARAWPSGSTTAGRPSEHVLAALPPELLTAPPHAIEAVLDHLDAHDGGVAGWFAAHGGEPEVVSALRARLLG